MRLVDRHLSLAISRGDKFNLSFDMTIAGLNACYAYRCRRPLLYEHKLKHKTNIQIYSDCIAI